MTTKLLSFLSRRYWWAAALFLLGAAVTSPAYIVINEVVLTHNAGTGVGNSPPAGSLDYIELYTTDDTTLSYPMTVLAINGNAGAARGRVTGAWQILNATEIPSPNGAQPGFWLSSYILDGCGTSVTNGTMTILLLQGNYMAALNSDYDLTNTYSATQINGTLAGYPWPNNAVLDAVSLVDGQGRGFSRAYAAQFGGPVLVPTFAAPGGAVAGASRDPSGNTTQSPSAWKRNAPNGAGIPVDQFDPIAVCGVWPGGSFPPNPNPAGGNNYIFNTPGYGNNDRPPVLDNIETATLVYSTPNTDVNVTATLTVTPGLLNNLVQDVITDATVFITPLSFVAGEDQLSFTSSYGITGSYNAGTGVLTLSGSTSAANYQEVLRSVTYKNVSGSPTPTARYIVMQVTDLNFLTSNTVIRTVNFAPAVTITSPSPNYVNGPFAVTFTFTQSVTGFVAADVSVGNGILSGFGGAGAVYNATVTPVSNGSVTVSVPAGVCVNSTNIGNTAATPLTRIYDNVFPTTVSINRFTPSAQHTNADSVVFRVTFSEIVTGVDIGDFAVQVLSGAVPNTIASVSGAGSVYDVTVNTISGDGEIRLNLVDDNSIVDLATNALGGPGAQDFTSGQTYIIDNTNPTVLSINRSNPLAAATNATLVTFEVKFSEIVTGVAINNFSLDATAAQTAASLGSVSGSGDTWFVTVNTANGDGDLSIDLSANFANIADQATNPLLAGFAAGQVYNIDRTPPVVNITAPLSGTYCNGDEVITFTSTGGGVQPQVSVDGTNWTNATSGVTVLSNIPEFAGLPQGAFTLYLRDTDAVGNIGTDNEPGLIKDTIAPVVDITSPTGNAQVNGSKIITFTDSDPFNPQVSVDGINWTNATSGVTSLGNIPEFAGLPQGTFTLYLRDIDLAGNVGSDSETLLIKDTIAPAGYSVSFDDTCLSASEVNAAAFTFAGAEVGTTYNYSITSSGGGAAVTGTGTIATATDTIGAIDVSGLNDGNLTLTVTLTDPAGNIGANATANATKDLVAPAGYSAAIDQSCVTNALASAISITVTSAEIGSTYNYSISSSGGPGTVTGTGLIVTATQQLTAINVTGLPDGTLTLGFTLTDLCGNLGADAPDTVEKDTVLPAGYSVALSEDCVNAAEVASVSFAFTAAEVGTTYNYTVSSSGGGANVTGNGLVTAADQTVNLPTLAGLGNGTLTLSVTLTDTCGNVGLAATDTALKDTAIPAGYSVVIDDSCVNAAEVANRTFTFTGAEVGTTFDYTVSSSGGGANVTGNGTVTSADQTVNLATLAGLNDGTLTLSVTLTDSCGNTGTAATDTATKDVAAPAGYAIDIVDSCITAAESTSISLALTGGEIGTTYNYSITSSGGPGSVTGTGTVAQVAQTFTGVNVSALPDGTLTIAFTLTDTCGNAGSNTGDTSTKDSVVPSGYSVAFADTCLNAGDIAAVSFAFTAAEVGTTYNYSISSSGGGTALTGSGTITGAGQSVGPFSVATLPDGTLTLSVTLTDDCGNIGTAATHTATKDVSAPNGYSVVINDTCINNSEQGNVSFSFTGAEVGTTYNYSLSSSGGGAPVTGSGAIASANQTIGSLNLTGLGDGLITLSVTLTDTCGNAGTAATDTADKDVGVPAGYTAVIDDTCIKASEAASIAILFSGAEIGTTYNYTITSNNGGAPVSASGTISAANQSVSGINVTGLSDGVLTLSATLTDGCGNVGTASTDSADKDTVVPAGYTALLDEACVNAAEAVSTAFTFTAAEVGTTYSFSIVSNNGGTPVTGTGTVTAANQQIAGINVTGLNDGTLTLSVTLTDTCGNIGTAATDTAQKDVTAPAGYSIAFNDSCINASEVANRTFTFTAAEVGATYDYTISSSGGAGNVTGNGTVTTVDQTVSLANLGGLADGTLTLIVTLSDPCGNTGGPVSDTATKDTAAPAAFTVDWNDTCVNAGEASAVSFTFGGAEIAATYNYSVSSSGGGANVTGSGVISSADQVIGGINLTGLGDGTITLSVTLTDPCGNVAGPSTDTATKDVVAPNGYDVTFADSCINASEDTSISIAYTGAEVGAAYTLSITSTGGGAPVTGSGTIAIANGNFAGIDVSGLGDGTLTVNLALTDSCGNAGATDSATTTKDTVAPSGYTAALGDSCYNAAEAGNASFSFAGAEVGSTYNFTITSNNGGAPVTASGTVTAADQTVAGINLGGLNDGVLTLSVTLTDPCGNVGAAATDNADKDTAIPAGYSVSVVQGCVNSSNVTNIGFQFAAAEVGTEYSAVFTSSGGGAPVTATGTVSSANQTINGFNLSTLGDGSLTLSVTLTDACGNTGAAATDTVNKDVLAPTGFTVTINDTCINASEVADRTFTFGSAETGTTYDYTVTSSGGAGSVTGTGAVSSANQTVNLSTLAALPDGTLTLSVTLTDTCGNVSVAATDTAVKDTAAPVGYTAAFADSCVNNAEASSTALTLTAGEVGAAYSFTITTSGGGGSVTGNGTVTSDPQTISGVDVSGLADGTLSLSLTLTDTCGNAGAAATHTTTKDATIPAGYSVVFDDSCVNASEVGAVTFSFTAAEVGTTYSFVINSNNGGTAVTGNGTVANAGQTINLPTLSGLNDGTLTISVTLTDTCGNTGAAATDTVTKDVVAPAGYTAALDDSCINASEDNATSFTVSAAEVGATFNYTISSSGGGAPVTGSGTIATALQTISSLDVSGLGDGTLSLSVTLTDPCGNTGTAATDDTQKDTVAPNGYAVAFDDSCIGSADAAATAISLTGAEVGATYNFSISSSGGGAAVTGSGVAASAAFSVSGINVAGLGDGTLTVSVTLTDPCGNTGAAATNTTTKDVVAPAGYTVAFDDTCYNATEVSSIGFTVSAGSLNDAIAWTVSSSGGGANVTGTATYGAGPTLIDLVDVSGLGDGTLTVSVTLTDACGNTGLAATNTATKDATAPTGYTVAFDDTCMEAAVVNSISFTMSTAEVGTTFSYSITSSGGPGSVSNTGTVTTATQVVSGLDVSALPDGTLTVSIALTDACGNTGAAATNTGTKDVAAPAGYSVAFADTCLSATEVGSAGFGITNGELNANFSYTVSSSGGGTNVTGSGVILSNPQTLSGLNLTGLNDGLLTISVTLTDACGNAGAAATNNGTKDIVAPSGYTAVFDDTCVNGTEASSTSITFGTAELGTTYSYTVTDGVNNATGSGTIASATQQITGIDISGFNQGTINLSAYLTDPCGNQGATVTNTTTFDSVAPTGFSVAWVDTAINASEQNNTSFTITGGEIGTTYTYNITSSGGGVPSTASGLVSANPQTVTGVSVSSLNDGTLTLDLYLTDACGNQGSTVQPIVPATKDVNGPVPGTVNDGPGADIDSQISTTIIKANWGGFTDAASGIASYEWAIGTAPGGIDVLAYTNVGTSTSATKTGLSLTIGSIYYVSVRGIDNAANTGPAASSDGVQVVNSPPEFGNPAYANGPASIIVHPLNTGNILSVIAAGTTTWGVPKIRVTTQGNHGLQPGEIVTISGTASYNGTYSAIATPALTSFEVTATFTNSQTGLYTAGGWSLPLPIFVTDGATPTRLLTFTPTVVPQDSGRITAFDMTYNADQNYWELRVKIAGSVNTFPTNLNFTLVVQDQQLATASTTIPLTVQRRPIYEGFRTVPINYTRNIAFPVDISANPFGDQTSFQILDDITHGAPGPDDWPILFMFEGATNVAGGHNYSTNRTSVPTQGGFTDGLARTGANTFNYFALPFANSDGITSFVGNNVRQKTQSKFYGYTQISRRATVTYAAWALQNGANVDPTVDTSGDGIPDYVAYAMGLDPTYTFGSNDLRGVTTDLIATHYSAPFPAALPVVGFEYNHNPAVDPADVTLAIEYTTDANPTLGWTAGLLNLAPANANNALAWSGSGSYNTVNLFWWRVPPTDPLSPDDDGGVGDPDPLYQTQEAYSVMAFVADPTTDDPTEIKYVRLHITHVPSASHYYLTLGVSGRTVNP